MRIRSMMPEDIVPCLGILCEEWGVAVSERVRPDFEDAFRFSGWSPKYFVCVLEEKVIGVSGYYPSNLSVGVYDVSWFCVAKAYRSRGFGSRLLQRCIDDVNILNGSMMAVTESPIFYEKLGFKVLTEDFIEGCTMSIVYLPTKKIQ